MGVPEGKRKESKIEFERAYDRIYDDCFELIKINDKLFPIKEREEKKSRKKLIDEIFEEEKELYEIFSTCRQ